MKSLYFNSEHQAFRDSVKQFVEKDVTPFAEKWEEERQVPRDVWRKMGELGFLGINYPEEYGGSAADFFYSIVFLEEIAKSGLGGFTAGVSVHQYMATAHISKAGSKDLKERYLVPSITGEKIGALAISEPNTGSDVSAIRTRAVRDGDYYIINGAKTFITNGYYGDFITLAVKTNPEAGVNGISLIVVDTNSEGFSAKKLKKMGWHCSDTAELFFYDVRVPASNIIGQENMGFYYIMESFQLERLVAAILAVGASEHCLNITMRYIKEREAFNRPISKFQTIRHTIADLVSELEAARQLTYYTSWLYEQGEVPVQNCSMAKLVTTELSKKIIDSCLQFFGGYGYMEEYPISRMYRDARVGTIVGGTSEIMREIISKLVIDNINYKTVYDNQSNLDSNTENKYTIEDIFNHLPERFRPEKAEGYEGVFHFNISGIKESKYTVKIANNKCIVENSLNGEPKCLIEVKDDVYIDIETGKVNPQAAFMSGNIKVSNVMEMMQFTKMFHKLKEK